MSIDVNAIKIKVENGIEEHFSEQVNYEEVKCEKMCRVELKTKDLCFKERVKRNRSDVGSSFKNFYSENEDLKIKQEFTMESNNFDGNDSGLRKIEANSSFDYDELGSTANVKISAIENDSCDKEMKEINEFIFENKEFPDLSDVESGNAAPKDIESIVFEVEEHQDQLSCDCCEFKTGNETTLQAHIDSVHFKLEHMNKAHLNSVPYSCSFCEYRSNRKYRLRIHINSVHLKLRPYKCLECDYEASEKSSLNRHIKTIHLNLKPFHCPHCEFKTTLNGHLKSHINNIHLNLKPFQCSECEYKTTRNNDLKSHIGYHHLNVKPFQCSQCEHKSTRKSSLKVHMDTVHLKLKPFSCSQCDFKTCSKSTLKSHVDIIHLKLKPYHCSKCDYKGSKQSKLTTHNKVHLK